MDSQELLEYKNKELYASKRGLRKCQLFKEYNPKFVLEDKVHFKEGYSTRLDPKIPIKMLLPFYKQNVVFIRPFKTPQDFKKLYGINDETF